ncbi:MAG: hypothetical protein ACI8PT_001889 [Gammaproteobacteria bacterium]
MAETGAAIVIECRRVGVALSSAKARGASIMGEFLRILATN